MSKEIVDAAHAATGQLRTIRGNASEILKLSKKTAGQSLAAQEALAQLTLRLEEIDERLVRAREERTGTAAHLADEANGMLHAVGVTPHGDGQSIFAAVDTARSKMKDAAAAVSPFHSVIRSLLQVAPRLESDFEIIAGQQKHIGEVAAAAGVECKQAIAAGEAYASNVAGRPQSSSGEA